MLVRSPATPILPPSLPSGGRYRKQASPFKLHWVSNMNIGFQRSATSNLLAFILLLCLGIAQHTNQAIAQSDTKGLNLPEKRVDKGTKKAPANVWIVSCSSVTGRFTCNTTQRLTVKKTGQTLISLRIQKVAKDKPPVMAVHLPHGIYLPEGVKFQVDKKLTVKAKIRTCDRSGCYTTIPIGDKMMAAIKKGKSLYTIFQNLRKKNVAIEASLIGFTKAFDQMVSAQSR